jgi:hypothetical protein
LERVTYFQERPKSRTRAKQVSVGIKTAVLRRPTVGIVVPGDCVAVRAGSDADDMGTGCRVAWADIIKGLSLSVKLGVIQIPSVEKIRISNPGLSYLIADFR